jgi:hypothetical protein
VSEELYKLRNRGMCRDFVKTRRGGWNHSEWIGFLAEIRKAGYGALSDGEVGLELEGAKHEFWKAYGDLRQTFVNGKQGNWNHYDWLAFLAEVRKAGYGFLTDAEVGRDLERDKSEYWNGARHRQTAESRPKQNRVTIRIECGKNSAEETFYLDGNLLLDAARLQRFSLPDPEKAGGRYISPVGVIGLAAAGFIGGFSISDILGAAQHAAQTVKVFIDTLIVGVALGVITKQVLEQVGKMIEKQLAESKAKREITVVLYGPDGKQIK